MPDARMNKGRPIMVRMDGAVIVTSLKGDWERSKVSLICSKLS